MSITYGMHSKCFVLTQTITFDPTNPDHVFTKSLIPYLDAVFDGNNFSISNIRIVGVDANSDGTYENNNLGLFQSIGRNGIVKNLRVDQIRIEGNEYLGGIAAQNSEGSIVNCSVSAIIKGGHKAKFLGGIAGSMGGMISNCSTNVVITTGNQSSYIGGLTGDNYGLIKECTVEVTILTPADSMFVGGIAGENNSLIEACSGQVDIQAGTMVGGIAGRDSWANILHCSTIGNVIAESSGGGCVGQKVGGVIAFCKSGTDVVCPNLAGGLIGDLNQGTCYACFNESEVAGTSNIGGFAGNCASGHILNSFADGYAHGTSNIGGFIGNSDIGSDISFCYSLTNVQGPGAGGFTGREYGAIINDCFWNKEIQTYGIQQSIGRFIFGYTQNLNALTTAQMQLKDTYINSNWDFAAESVNGVINFWDIPAPNQYPVLTCFNGYIPATPQGNGTLKEPYLISDISDLACIPYFPFACYKLTENLDFAGYDWMSSMIPFFAGTFDGQCHVLNNVSLGGGGHLGFFGTIESSGKIINLSFNQGSVTTISQKSYGCGMLAGLNRGTVASCSSASVNTGGSYCGGLIGVNEGKISRCASYGIVQGYYSVGGLVGNAYSGIIEQCYSDAVVTGTLDCVGGFAGSAAGSLHCDILNCYAKGQVSGNTKIGGFVGRFEYGSGQIKNSYSTASTSGLSQVGGFIGINSNSVIVNSYFLNSAGPNNGYGTSLSEQQFKLRASFIGWNFVGESVNGENDIWRMCVDGVDYPRLSWEFARDGDFACGDGMDITDLISLAEHWLMSGTVQPAEFSYACDANGDEQINLYDLEAFSSNW